MSHSLYNVWVHAVWATQYRKPLIHESIEQQVHQLLFDQLVKAGCRVSIINGMPDHVHSFFGLSPNKSLADIIKIAKGVSSNYINQHGFIEDDFSWQTGYSAFSVSPSQFRRVYNYIKNQKTHHATKTFLEEQKTLWQMNDAFTIPIANHYFQR